MLPVYVSLGNMTDESQGSPSPWKAKFHAAATPAEQSMLASAVSQPRSVDRSYAIHRSGCE
jgi:hypothetical protein